MNSLPMLTLSALSLKLEVTTLGNDGEQSGRIAESWRTKWSDRLPFFRA